MDVFAPNSKFWEEYEELRAEDKLSANVFLLVCELAFPSGKLRIKTDELPLLFDARFNDPEEDAREIGIYSYQLESKK